MAEYPSLDVSAHLRTHGANASYERVIVGEVGVADHVLNRAADLDADLIVLGVPGSRGMTHLGGEDTAAALIRTSPTAVLLSA